MTQDFDKLTIEATKNVRDDRAQAKELLQDLIKYLSGADERHKEVGLTAAKYMETLQRSNEQLVKIAALQRKSSVEETSLSEEDRSEIFEELNKNKHGN